MQVEAGLREHLRLSGARRQKGELIALHLGAGERPPSVRRQAERGSFSEADGGRAVELAQVDARGGYVLFVEENGLAVGADVRGERPVEPGQVAFRLVADRHADDLAAG